MANARGRGGLEDLGASIHVDPVQRGHTMVGLDDPGEMDDGVAPLEGVPQLPGGIG